MCFLPVTLLLACALHASEAGLERFEFSGVEMAVPVRIVLYAPDEESATRAWDAAMKRIREINGIMSDYDPTTEVRRLSATAGTGQAVEVSDDLWEVLDHAKRLSEKSDGAFDVTVGPFVRLWRRARRHAELPSQKRIEQYTAAVGHQYLELDPANRTARLTRPDMWIDLGGIAKGYAIDAALEVLEKRGITSALIDAGGDIGLTDAPPDRSGWVIGVAPLESDARPSVFLSLSNVAIATSGDTWQFVEIEGKRYSHIVDPRTGIGLTDHSSVTAIAADAMTADGLASAVSVLGPEAGIQLIEESPGAAAFVVRAPEGRPDTFQSQRWGDYPTVQPKSLPTPDRREGQDRETSF